jgi:D-beta-D-heptose 7-phosphate kinase/D-beta-D-heptose 1-phosphate adenosyltransferase
MMEFPAAEDIKVYDVVGAGDTFMAALVSAYNKSHDMHKSIVFAIAAASLAVQKPGTALVTRDEINQFLGTGAECD